MNEDELLALERIPVTVKPSAAKTEILGVRNDSLHVALKAPPIEGKANEELLKFLQKQTGKRCELVSGATSRKKIVRCH